MFSVAPIPSRGCWTSSAGRSCRAAFFLLLLTLGVRGADPPPYPATDYGFARLFEQAKADPKWDAAKTVSERIWLVRACASRQATVSTPVSDRYMVTCYGGSIDLVHFLGLAAILCSGQADLGPRLYQEWVAEGGRDNKRHYNESEPPEAHPDDLPSNALGALFGLELKNRNADLDLDLQTAFEAFIRPLIPVPDSVAKTFSHRQIVMGLGENEPRELERSRRAWFTAAPLLHCATLNAVARQKLGAPLCQESTDGEQALRLAGLRIIYYKGEPILVRRLAK